MNSIFFKALFNISAPGSPSTVTQKKEVVHTPTETNTSEGGEYLDDNIRMEEPASQYVTIVEDGKA